jgi:hypothetical protein
MPSFNDGKPVRRQPKTQSIRKANLKTNLKPKLKPKPKPKYDHEFEDYGDSDAYTDSLAYSDPNGYSDSHGYSDSDGPPDDHTRRRTQATFNTGCRHAAQWPNNFSEQIGYMFETIWAVLAGIFRNLHTLVILFILLLLLVNAGDWCHEYQPTRFLSSQVAKLGVGDFCVADSNFDEKDGSKRTPLAGEMANATSAMNVCLDLSPGITSVGELVKSFDPEVSKIFDFFKLNRQHFENPRNVTVAMSNLSEVQRRLTKASSSFRLHESLHRQNFDLQVKVLTKNSEDLHSIESDRSPASKNLWGTAYRLLPTIFKSSTIGSFFGDYIGFFDKQIAMVDILLGQSDILIYYLTDIKRRVKILQAAHQCLYQQSAADGICNPLRQGWSEHRSGPSFCSTPASDLEDVFRPMLDLTQWQIDYMTLVRKEHVNLGQKLMTIRKSLLKQMGRYAKASVHATRTLRLNSSLEGQAAALPIVTTRSFRPHEARSWLLDIRGFLIFLD